MEQNKETINKTSFIEEMDPNKSNEVSTWKEKKVKWCQTRLNKTLEHNIKRLKNGKDRLISLLSNTEFPLIYSSNNTWLKFCNQIMKCFSDLNIKNYKVNL